MPHVFLAQNAASYDLKKQSKTQVSITAITFSRILSAHAYHIFA